MSFPDLVRLHGAWRDELEDRPATAWDSTYFDALRAFERSYGRIENVYWCSGVPSAVALTVQEPPRWQRWLGRRPRINFHRVTDWATRAQPDVAQVLHDCDSLAVRVAEVLHRKTQRICMRLIMASATHALSLVDEPSSEVTDEERAAALAAERDALDFTRRYYEEVGSREAEIVYFGGMASGVATLAGAAGVMAWQHWFSFPGRIALVAGALGGLVSVMARMASESYVLDYELGRPALWFFGLLRPLLGSAFGLALYAALNTGFINIKIADGQNEQTWLEGFIAFVGGFSERLAKDVLDAASTTVAGAAGAKAAPAETATASPRAGA